MTTHYCETCHQWWGKGLEAIRAHRRRHRLDTLAYARSLLVGNVGGAVLCVIDLLEEMIREEDDEPEEPPAEAKVATDDQYVCVLCPLPGLHAHHRSLGTGLMLTVASDG